MSNVNEILNYAMVQPNGQIMQVTSGPYRFIRCDETVTDESHYVTDDDVIELKRPVELDISVEGLTVTITGLPLGIKIETNGMETEADDEPLIITYDIPGSYHIFMSGHVEYLNRSLEVEVGHA